MEKLKAQKCVYHKMIENKLRRELGWNEHQFSEYGVSAAEILETDVEDYILKNGARWNLRL